MFHESTIEGRTYKIGKFSTAKNYGDNMATYHPCRIYFDYSTSITETKDIGVPNNKYNFVDFNDIIHHNVDDKHYIDVVAELHDYDPIYISKNGVQYTKIDLKDKNGDMSYCMIWGPYCDEISTIINMHKENDFKPILAIQYVKRFKWNGHTTLGKDCVTTNRGATKIIVNPNISEARAVFSRMQIDRSLGLATKLKQSACDIYDIFTKSEMKSLKEILNTTKAGNFLTAVTILEVVPKRPWYYNSCNACRKKSVLGLDGLWMCTNDDCMGFTKPMKEITPRFFVTFSVQGSDDADVAEIQMFDNHINTLVKESARDILAMQEKSANKEGLPIQLRAFIELEVVVTLNVSRERNLDVKSSCYTVKAISCDQAVVAKWKRLYAEKQVKGKEILDANNDQAYGTMKSSPPDILMESPKIGVLSSSSLSSNNLCTDGSQNETQNSANDLTTDDSQNKTPKKKITTSKRRISSSVSISSDYNFINDLPTDEEARCKKIMAIKQEKL